jgi:predicted dehydrogenase
MSAKEQNQDLSRRDFVKRSTMATAGLSTGLMASSNYAFPGGTDTIQIGLVGCGGRGTGAANDCYNSSDGIELVAMGDLFQDRMEKSKGLLQKRLGDGFKVTSDRTFLGFDAYKKVLQTDVDLVLFATPPAYRPIHLKAAVEADKHVFIEKPVATDPAGIRSIMSSAEKAKKKGLSIVAGTQRRHHPGYIETMQRLRDGAIGEIVGGRAFYNTGELWLRPRKPDMSDMEWQCRNWYYFTWLSGDHITEQAVHRLDLLNWAMGGPPEKAVGVGGRQVRTDPSYGHIFDHFAIEYTYSGGTRLFHMCRQMDQTAGEVGEYFQGTQGRCRTSDSELRIEGANGTWRFDQEVRNPYVQEHADLIASIRSGEPVNEAKRVARSTLTAILGREAAYTGQKLTWDQIRMADQNLRPDTYEFGSAPFPPVPAPGETSVTRGWGQ